MESEAANNVLFLEGVARGDPSAVKQLRWFVQANCEQAARLTTNNERLRARIKILLDNHTALEGQVLDLKSARSKEVDEAHEQMRRCRAQLETHLEESNFRNRSAAMEMAAFEACIADNQRALSKCRAENLMLKVTVSPHSSVMKAKHTSNI